MGQNIMTIFLQVKFIVVNIYKKSEIKKISGECYSNYFVFIKKLLMVFKAEKTFTNMKIIACFFNFN